MTSPSFAKVVWINFLFTSFLSFNPSRKAFMKFLDQFFNYFSGNAQRTSPAK